MKRFTHRIRPLPVILVVGAGATVLTALIGIGSHHQDIPEFELKPRPDINDVYAFALRRKTVSFFAVTASGKSCRTSTRTARCRSTSPRRICRRIGPYRVHFRLDLHITSGRPTPVPAIGLPILKPLVVVFLAKPGPGTGSVGRGLGNQQR